MKTLEFYTTVVLTPHQLRELADTLDTLDVVSVTLSPKQEQALYSHSHAQSDD